MKEISITTLEKNLKYLKLLSSKYPTIASVCTEIINLQAILNLRKGTEHFLADIHGEDEAFTHVLRNASGVLRTKIEEIFGNSLRGEEKRNLATLIYYPEKKLEIIKSQENNMSDWYRITLYRLTLVCRHVSSKYTRSKVRKALPEDFAYIIEELLHEDENRSSKQEYYNQIIETILEIDSSDQFIIAISKIIQRLAVDRLHIVGDIYDRGPGAHIIMDALSEHHSIDIQWGNHDMVWMGAAAGNKACMANVIRLSTRYANLKTLEVGYGINLFPLATFASEYYGDDPCYPFRPKMSSPTHYSEKDLKLISQMHKAITIIQYKLEREIIARRPEFEMESRLLLHKIDFAQKTVEVEGKIHSLIDTNFPTLEEDDPYLLSPDEAMLVDKLMSSFRSSEKLRKHIRFLYAKGSMYLKYNSNLLYHGCIPLKEDGSFQEVPIRDSFFKGKELMDQLDRLVREAYFSKEKNESKEYSLDMTWYLWCGKHSPIFGKDKMTSFEQYFIEDKATHKEIKNHYYQYNEEYCVRIIQEFGLDPETSHIINGHVPVKAIKGESPVKANGKLLVIDGGFSKAYQKKTGLAGYTLIYNSYGLLLVSHEPFESTQKAIEEEKDIHSTIKLIEKPLASQKVIDTDLGKVFIEHITELKQLLTAYRRGLIQEETL